MRIDPDDVELSHIFRYASPEGKRVLDIGCGDGDLTCTFGALSAITFGIDPDFSDVRTALSQRLDMISDLVQFLAARAQALPFPDETFDITIFTSSL